MNNGKIKLTLDRPVTYEIKVPGHIDENWVEWTGWMTTTIESKADGSPISTLTGKVDQAGLQGLLRQLYSKGLPLISAICVDLSDWNIAEQE
jgi:hypothetical protein